MRVKQSIPKELRFTVKDFHKKFPNDDACLEYLKEKRYPGGICYCDEAECKIERKHHRVTGRPAYACDYCGKMISPMAGTIFEKSSTPLKTWFYAMYLMGSTRCGISAKQIQRETGVTYKTAWRMFRQIRSLLSDDDLKLEGPTVEIDETYYGGVRKFGRGRPMRGDKKKTPVVAIVQRKGKVIARAVRDVSGKSIYPLIRKHVAPGSVIYTDEFAVYDGISKIRTVGGPGGTPANFKHFRIKHADGVYVRGDVHTNSVEGLWSLIKRGIGGVYHSVSPAYLQTYLNEYTFRYNRRHEGNQQFNAILERVCERAS
ncbi:MAG TPA: IS1595 family transposase [Candidatus Sulfotelmatobacter sp.]|nr:IS1595 family transposase [Candidatus Sulfotelmatobacter sp.]